MRFFGYSEPPQSRQVRPKLGRTRRGEAREPEQQRAPLTTLMREGRCRAARVDEWPRDRGADSGSLDGCAGVCRVDRRTPFCIGLPLLVMLAAPATCGANRRRLDGRIALRLARWIAHGVVRHWIRIGGRWRWCVGVDLRRHRRMHAQPAHTTTGATDANGGVRQIHRVVLPGVSK